MQYHIHSKQGHNGYGLIEDITYRNLNIYRAIWFAIYIGHII